MFSSSFNTLNITDYTKALSKWEGIKPIRGRRDQNTRPLYRRGDDTKTIRQIVRLRTMDKAKRQEAQALLDLYLSALGWDLV